MISLNRISKILLVLCLIGMPSIVLAWPKAVDFSADEEGGGAPLHKHAATQYDRCDTPSGEYGETPPSICHRWGLVFEYGAAPTVWKPKVSGDSYRLPTIKELVRLYNYADPANAKLDPIISKWLGNDINVNTWLISSSYRDLDGSYDAGTNGEGRLQVFALNALTGEVRAFEPGQKSGVNGLKLCVSLQSNGDCVLDLGDTKIHALKVNRTLLKDL
jgi:hypothetical protein